MSKPGGTKNVMSAVGRAASRWLFLGAWFLLGCGGTGARPSVAPDVAAEHPEGEAPTAEGAVPMKEAAHEGPIPFIPTREGPLDLTVQYPGQFQRISVRDSNFILGSVSTGDATLEIDGYPVAVEPNGAFLAWLPVPEKPETDTAVYRLVARRGLETDTLLLPVLLPPRPYSGRPGTVWLDTTALSPPEERWLLPREAWEMRIRGAPGLRVWLAVGSDTLELWEDRHGDEVSVYAIRIPAARLRRSTAATEVGAGLDTLAMEVVGVKGADTLRVQRQVLLRVLDPAHLPVAELREAPDTVNGRSGVIVGRTTPFGPYQWRFPPGTRAVLDGRVGSRLRLRLAPQLDVWVREEDARILASGSSPPHTVVGDVRMQPRNGRLELRVGLGVAVPIQVEEPDDRTLVLTLYGAQGETERVAYGELDELLESIDWKQDSGGRYRITVRLRQPIWGYRAFFERADGRVYGGLTGGDLPGEQEKPVLRLDIRRPPRIDPAHPFRNRRIAVDPGHPGGGAYGPTGYYEGDANLAVAQSLVRMLEEQGAEAILIRADTLPVGLYERTRRARARGAELFVSVHNNALPDGVRPFGRSGTSTYYFYSHSRALAESVQAGLVKQLGLQDLGILWGDLAVVRESWMPAILTEGAFMIIPRQEAALRSPEFQRRYARGILEGLRHFLDRQAAAGAEHR